MSAVRTAAVLLAIIVSPVAIALLMLVTYVGWGLVFGA